MNIEKEQNRLREERNKLQDQVNLIQNQIDKISIFKTGMYESMLDGIISKSEFTDMKKQYDFNLVRLNGAKAVVTAEYEKAKANEDEKMRWIKHFKNFSEMENLSRSAIVQLIQHITIGADMEIHIKFRYIGHSGYIFSALSCHFYTAFL